MVGPWGLLISVNAMLQHPGYDANPSDSYPYNLAIIYLDGQIPNDSPYIQTLALAESGKTPEDYFDMECVFMGWGAVYSKYCKVAVI